MNYSHNITAHFRSNIQHLKKESYVSLTYEELCNHPNEIMQNILTFLNVTSPLDFSSFIQQRTLSLNPEIKFMKRYIHKKMKPYYDYINDEIQ